MRTAIKEYIRGCDICQRCKTECLQPAGLLQPLLMPKIIWTAVSMDFIDGFPPS